LGVFLSHLSYLNNPEQLLSIDQVKDFIEGNLDWYYCHSDPSIMIPIDDGFDCTFGKVVLENYHCISHFVIN
jgi:hypothetical protein